MRLLSLDLERYGPFTGRRLEFRSDARLHVVYGPNEAGKSSALAALADLFFGFEKSTPYDFIHKTSELRIGATIVSRSGQMLEFRRRKGNKDTLLDLAGSPLRDDALSPFLGGLTREVFLKSFGLSSASLREGAEELLASDAESGTGLFAAASGLHGLRKLVKALDGEADAIFGLRDAGHRRFYRALDRHKAARLAIQESEVRAPAWMALNEEIAALEVKIAEQGRQRQAHGRERARLERLGRVKPVLALIERDLERLEAFADLPLHDPGAAARLADAMGFFQGAREAEAREAEQAAKAQRDLAEIAVEDAVLEREGEIAAIRDLSAYRKFAEDAPRIEAEAAGFRHELQALAVRLGLAGAAELERRQPSDAAKARVAELVSEGRNIDAEIAGLERELAAERDELAKLAVAQSEAAEPADPAALRQAFEALRPALSAIAGRAGASAQWAAERARLAERALRLNPPAANLDRLAVAPLPGTETVARFRKLAEDSEQELRRAGEAKQRAEMDLAKAGTVLAKMNKAGAPPSAEAIAEARAVRDRTWAEIADRLSGLHPRPEAELAGLARALVGATALADRLADEAIRDAERVAAYGNATAERLRALGVIEAAARDGMRLAAENSALAGRWAGEWASAGIVPLPASDMPSWLSAVKALLDERDKLKEDEGRLALLATRAGEILDRLRPLAAAAGLSGRRYGDAEDAAKDLELRLKELESAWNERRRRDAKREAVIESIRRKEARRQIALAELERWRTQWRPAVSAVGFLSDSSLAEANAALAAWQDAPSLLRQRDSCDKRVEGMRREMRAIEAKAVAPVAALDPGLARLDIPDAIEALGERLDRAKEAAARRSDAGKRVAVACRGHEEAVAARRHGAAALAAVLAGFPGAGAPEALLARLAERDGLLRHLERCREELARAGAGFGENDLRQELAGFEPDAAEAALSALAHTEAGIVDEEKELHALLKEKAKRRDGLEAGTGAELAGFARRSAEAELAGLAREWLVLKLGQGLIEQAVKRHRLGREGALMGRAGEMFQRLTGGGFAALEQQFGDGDRPQLMARRAGGGAVGVAGLSEGTRDQLYLALRLAFLEDYAAKAEPAPFVADDILTTFDDARAGHGLEVLAAAGEGLQPILFTHHRSIADTALARLGEAVEVIAL